MDSECVIWGTGFPAQSRRSDSPNPFYIEVDDSPRAGGGYKIDSLVTHSIYGLSQQEKARLTTWIVDQNAQGVRLPDITREIVEYAKNRQPLPVYERANRLLRWLAGQTTTVADRLIVSTDTLQAFAVSESTIWPEIAYFLNYLHSCGWSEVSSTLSGGSTTVTVEGHRYVESQISDSLANQGFVAMWFDGSMKEVRQKGIIPGIEDAGYMPYVVDEDEHIDKIDDKIIAEIRRSRFIVADFTHGEKGARGGVYFEAGFALGFGIPVIYTCRKDQIEDVHFDTRQYNHILWETTEELRSALANRIRRRLGQGPVPVVGA